jgi:surfactin synthase thioesterase subunit
MNKPQLLLLPGALGASSMFVPITNKLKEDYELFLYDFPGHGNRKSLLNEVSFESAKKDVFDFLKQNNLIDANVFGYSMGGYIAMGIASENNCFNKVITLGTKFLWNDFEINKELSNLDVEKMAVKIPAFVDFLCQRHPHTTWKEIVSFSRMFIQDLAENSLQFSNFSKVNVPVKIMLGENDNMVSKEETIDVKNAIKNAEFCQLPNSAHVFEKVDLDVLVNEIKSFI